MPVRFAGVRGGRNENQPVVRDVLRSGGVAINRLLVLGVPVGDHSNLDVVLCTQLSGESRARTSRSGVPRAAASAPAPDARYSE